MRLGRAATALTLLLTVATYCPTLHSGAAHLKRLLRRSPSALLGTQICRIYPHINGTVKTACARVSTRVTTLPPAFGLLRSWRGDFGRGDAPVPPVRHFAPRRCSGTTAWRQRAAAKQCSQTAGRERRARAATSLRRLRLRLEGTRRRCIVRAVKTLLPARGRHSTPGVNQRRWRHRR
jgi:hypothetical protein